MAKTSNRPRPTPSQTAGTPPPVNWTVMVYMAANRDDAETERAAIRDLRELQRVGSTEAVKVVVQLDRTWPGIPERYVVREGVSEAAPGPKRGRKGAAGQLKSEGGDWTSSGDLASISSFLEWGLDYHPANHYALVLWGHSFGLGFSAATTVTH